MNQMSRPWLDHQDQPRSPPRPHPEKSALLIPVRADAGELAAAEKPLPALLQVANRSAGGRPDPFLANVVVEESYPLAAVGRGEAPDTRRIEDGRKLLALEAADGTTIFMRSDRLQEELARLGDWVWQNRDAIIDLSLAHAKQRAIEWLGEKAAETIDADLGASALGARALMWAIESLHLAPVRGKRST